MLGQKNNDKGQSILEVIIAIGVITTGLVGALSLATANISSAKENESRVVAYNLAREALEIVRNIRDSNWLTEADWNYGLRSHDSYEAGKDYTAVSIFDWQSEQWLLDFRPDFLGQAATELYYNGELILQPTDGARAINFYRLITMWPDCQNGSVIVEEGLACEQNNPQVGLKAVAEVLWHHRDEENSVSLQEDIFDWK